MRDRAASAARSSGTPVPPWPLDATLIVSVAGGVSCGRLVARRAAPPGASSEHSDRVATPAYARLLDKLSAEHHFDFRQYKIDSLVRRIQVRMSQVGLADVDAYIELLDRQPG